MDRHWRVPQAGWCPPVSAPSPKPAVGQPSVPTTEQGLFGAYVRELFAFVLSDSEGRGGGADAGKEAALLRSRSERDAQADRGVPPSGGVQAPSRDPAETRVQPAAPVLPDARRRAAELGLQTVAGAWPDGALGELGELLDFTAAVELLWATPQPAGTEMHRARSALDERLDAAVRLLSSSMYAMARAQGLPEEVLDRGGAEFASFLGERLFRDGNRVFASQRQSIIDAQHQLSGRPGPNPRVRCIAFGIKDGRGAIVSKAIVEADVQHGGVG